MNDGKIIREGGPGDLETIIDFNIAMARETESIELVRPTVTEGVRRALADAGKGRYFLAEIEGKVVGQLMLTHEWSDWRDGDIWWIQSVYVHPDFRGRGVFAAIYRHVEEAARADQVVGLRLYVEKHNDAAKRIYARLGMKLTYYDVMEQMFSGKTSRSEDTSRR